MEVIDFRSDTVTKPCAKMREAMARAEVGDDVYGEDPTVNALQEMGAEILGMDAALFVPSGTMANLIAVSIQTRPGDEVHVGAKAHNWLFETGGAGAIAGVQHCVIPGDGRFTAEDVRSNYKADDHHLAPTTLVSIENTHNMGGGILWDQAEVQRIVEVCRELGLGLHLDGARLWNAAIAQNLSMPELTKGFDSVSVCLSKGLGAPVGSLIAGSKAVIHNAHRMRKRVGGGMRQAGILAAAGIFALERRARLSADHEHAQALAKGLNGIDGVAVDVEATQTNIVMADLEEKLGTAAELVDAMKAEGLYFYAVGPQRIRLVTHLDRSAQDAATATERIAQWVSAR